MQFTKIGSDGRPMTGPKLFAFLDERTGLMWAAEDVSAERMSHADALKAIDQFNDSQNTRPGQWKDWRLPTLLELETLRDLSRHDPAADPDLGLKSAGYWTSSPAAYSPAGFAWVVDFHYGDSGWGHRDGRYFVRAVRSASPAAASQ